MKPNDLIVAIDDKPVTDMTLEEAVDKLRGPIGSQVKVTVRRRPESIPSSLPSPAPTSRSTR